MWSGDLSPLAPAHTLASSFILGFNTLFLLLTIAAVEVAYAIDRLTDDVLAAAGHGEALGQPAERLAARQRIVRPARSGRVASRQNYHPGVQPELGNLSRLQQAVLTGRPVALLPC